MAYRVSVSRRATRDLENLYESINAEQSSAAARWFNGLENAILHLEQAPRLGVVTHESAGVRQLIYGNKPHFYRILYQVDDHAHLVTIQQIRHGRRRPFRPVNP